MEASILNSTKKILGIDTFYTAFDLDVITHINATFAVLDDLGIGPVGGFFITDSDDEWVDTGLTDKQINMIRTYIFLKVRYLFDPPTTSFLLDAVKNQIAEYEWRLRADQEYQASLVAE